MAFDVVCGDPAGDRVVVHVHAVDFHPLLTACVDLRVTRGVDKRAVVEHAAALAAGFGAYAQTVTRYDDKTAR